MKLGCLPARNYVKRSFTTLNSRRRPILDKWAEEDEGAEEAEGTEAAVGHEGYEGYEIDKGAEEDEGDEVNKVAEGGEVADRISMLPFRGRNHPM